MLDVSKFFHDFIVDTLDHVLYNHTAQLIENIGVKYSILISTISLLELISRNKKNEKILKLILELISYANYKFPPVLLLMNINGCVVYKTNKAVSLITPDKMKDAL